MKLIGKGKTKRAYALDETRVYKTGPSGRIAKQARRLRRLDRHGVPVAKVLDVGDGWLVQERCDCSSPAPACEVDALQKRARKAGFFVHDLHEKNVGLLHGRWVIIDCGALGKR